MFELYYSLTKPGIIYGNLVTVVAGFLIGGQGFISWPLLLGTLAGIALVMASGCVANNVIDRDIDRFMERTKNRALAQGVITPARAWTFALMLGALGAWILFTSSTELAALFALAGLFLYVVPYTLWAKRATVLGTLVGSFAGAMPPVVGYVAIAGRVDLGAPLLFSVLVFWQMVHSYAIAVYRLEDYVRANVHVLPNVRGVLVAKMDMVIYATLTFIAMLMLALSGFVGLLYIFGISVAGIAWIGLSVRGFSAADDSAWAKQMLLASIAVLVFWCALIGVDILMSSIFDLSLL